MQNHTAKPNKKQETIGWIEKLEKLNNSVMGNPRYLLVIDTADGVIRGKTKSDVMWAYAMPDCGKLCNITLHYTKTGKVVIDTMDAVN